MTIAAAAARKAPRAGRPGFYWTMSVVAIGIAVAGFLPGLLKPAVRLAPITPLVAAHGVVSLAWLILFFAQTSLVAAGRTDLHRRLGMAAAGLIIPMVIPDCDYVGGVVEERNLGEYDHARLQVKASAYFLAHEKEWGIYVVIAQRVQVSPTRFRVPDVCVVAGAEPTEQIFRQPPFICIEILSPEDRLSNVLQRVDDYLAFGVRYIWLLDPQTRKAFRCTSEGMQQIQELRTENPETLVPLATLFDDRRRER